MGHRRNGINKSIVYISFILFLLLWTNSLLSQEGTQVVVSNAGTSEVNGTYNYLTTENEKAIYGMGNYLIAYVPTPSDVWIIMLSNGPPDYVYQTHYYSNDDSAANNPPQNDWNTIYELGGVDPPPTLSGDGTETGTSVSTIDVQIPKEMTLDPAYPNPFNPQTRINYHLSSNTNVKLSIVNIMGHTIRELVRDTQLTGSYQIYWNGKDTHGISVPSGTYFIVLSTTNDIKIQKVLLLR